MKIGNLTLANNVILAPLAGITNLPFRLMAKQAGCGLVCSEMVSSHGLVYKSHKTAQMLNSVSMEKPLSAQIFGSEPDIMAGAAAIELRGWGLIFSTLILVARFEKWSKPARERPS